MIGIIRKVLCIFMATFLCASIVLPKQILSIEGQDKTTLSLEFKYCQGEARAMLGLLNAFRTGKEAWVYNEQNEKVYIDGLQPLIYDYRLEELAMQRAAELVLNYDHVRPNGTYYYDLIMPEGYYDASGENISMGTASFMDYKMAFTFWQETNENYVGQGHRRNMLSPSYTSTGISCVEYNGMKFWVQLFANRIIQSDYKDPINSLKKVDIEVIDNEVLAFIKRLYRLCLNREADKAGISYWWLSLVNQSIMAADAVKGFFTSNEMNKLNLSDEEFVSRCYRVMMDREGDVAGKAGDDVEVDENRVEILDGLQRTYRLWVILFLEETIRGAVDKSLKGIAAALKASQKGQVVLENSFVTPKFMRGLLEVEDDGRMYIYHLLDGYARFDVYFNIWTRQDDQQIIHRMLVLNAGQKAVSSTHQFELMFLHFFEDQKLQYDQQKIHLVREKDPRFRPVQRGDREMGEFLMSSVVIALQSFINGR
ncbi:MAG: DUF4214 domain-containing protein, partial [Solobacterium sp.]|nr:DUF4214 domain-containing protein [Solobacterium sp.]